jgi:hypothetical protein
MRPFSEKRLLGSANARSLDLSEDRLRLRQEKPMHPPSLIVGTLMLMHPIAAHAQHSGGAPGPATKAPREATQYDFLVGQWELTVTPKVSGLAARIHGVPKLHGSLRAWRALDGWGIEDEMRVVDQSGNPQALTHFVRIYDPAAKRWSIVAVDVYRQRLTQSTAQWDGTAMTSLGDGRDGEGRSYQTRTRISGITPTSFRYQQDRSYDSGKSWDEALLTIDARRVAASAQR